MAEKIKKEKIAVWRRLLRVFLYSTGAIVLLFLASIILYVVLDNITVEGPHKVFQDVQFGADRETLVYSYCPELEDRPCFPAIYNIATKKAYLIEMPRGPSYSRWPSVSPDGSRIVVSSNTSAGFRLVVIDLKKRIFHAMNIEPRDWAKATFSSDGQSVFAYARLKDDEWGEPSDYGHQQNMKIFDIFEVRLRDDWSRRVSNNPLRRISRLSILNDRILHGGTEKYGDSNYREVIWQLPAYSNGVVEPQVLFRTRMISSIENQTKHYNEDAYFEGVSDKGDILFASVNPQFDTCCGYNLSIRNNKNEIRKITHTYDHYGSSTDLSRDGSRVIYNLADNIPASKNYRNFVLLFSTEEQIKERQKGTGFFYVDTASEGGKPIRLEFPKKIEDYTPMRLRPGKL